MTVQLYPNIYNNEIALPNNPLRAINSYIILSDERNLIIDTGFNTKECMDAFMQGVKELNVDLKKTDLFITHLHSDHSGLAYDLSKLGVRVYAGEIDGKIINEMTKDEYWEVFDESVILFDLEKDNVSYKNNPGYEFTQKDPVEFVPIKEGFVINVGDYSFNVVDIPGHTPGHIGLYEKEHKLFFCGDHILDKITPNITFWGFEQDMLSVYLDNLNKVYEYDIRYLFTAHRQIVTNHRKRIDELYEHHQERLKQIITIIGSNKTTARNIAAKMRWSIKCNSWDEFPNPQKWFATGEVVAHLEYLVCKGKVKRTTEKGILYYELIK